MNQLNYKEINKDNRAIHFVEFEFGFNDCQFCIKLAPELDPNCLRFALPAEAGFEASRLEALRL